MVENDMYKESENDEATQGIGNSIVWNYITCRVNLIVFLTGEKYP